MKAKYEDFLERCPHFKEYAETDGFRKLFDEMNAEPRLWQC